MERFLGAGKTTLINHLLTTKPTEQRWALLINEFGRIGIDGTLLKGADWWQAAQETIAVREVSGGCICCTSQLPLQIAISRLLSEHKPQRLLIEPTGLAHPRELFQQLSEPHWQTALQMQAVLTVLNAKQWQQAKYREHEGFAVHVQEADALIINRYDHLSADEIQALQAWIATLNPHAIIIWAAHEPAAAVSHDSDHSNNPDNSSNGSSDKNDTLPAYITMLREQLTKPSQVLNRQHKVALEPLAKSALRMPLQGNTSAVSALAGTTLTGSSAQNNTDNELPYRYHETQQDLLLAGWRLPAHYVLPADTLQRRLPNWQRVKGVVYTLDGWLQLNFTPDSLTTRTVGAQSDSRLEVILQGTDNGSNDGADHTPVAIDWQIYDRQLMAMVVALG
ncbi:CobW family GTP-binding protein [Psychrobacter sp. HII-4]|uniref:CobW family GTP-binding protein n=1 Tax=Psychrobacter sp. HII-4 TaxID=1569264 RepID=UPI00191AC207|nr:GTP-binding protein [Psychrobacter sp. HII-4]